MAREALTTHRKALQVNLDKGKYGTFAEIGAGQEVARWFFRVGAAAGTVAKAMSAYDMVFSDAIYGPAKRFVSRERLLTMLDHEYKILIERLGATRGEETRFFVFANTVATRSYAYKQDGHGWLGMRFQRYPGEPPSDIVVHVRLWDNESVQQQEALGILGVNLVHGALYVYPAPEQLVDSLVDNLTVERIEIDTITFSGPAFEKVDNRLLCFRLVERGLTNAAMFASSGQPVQAADALHRKCVFVERGSFRPITKLTRDMFVTAHAQFLQDLDVNEEDVLALAEITMHNLVGEGGIDHRDFLDRVDMLNSLGLTVLVSDYGEFYRLAQYLFRYTKQPVALALGIPALRKMFDPRYYSDLEGGILESFGRMFKNDLRLYIYPQLEDDGEGIVTAENLKVAPNLKDLYRYLYDNRFIRPIQSYDPGVLSIRTGQVLSRIQSGDSRWEAEVPPRAAEIIKARKHFGYTGS